MILTRNRFSYFIFLIISIVLGLFSRSSLIELPLFLSAYAGDTVWAMVVYFMFCFIFKNEDIKTLLIYATLFSFGIELSQLYQSPWINELRNIKIVGLLLGYGFKFSDLICYTVGISAGAVFDFFYHTLKRQSV